MANEVAVLQQQPRSVTVDMATRYGMEPAAFEHTMRATVFPSNGSREQFAAFLLVAKVYNLNPLTKEIYAFPAKGGGIVPVVSIDGWMNLINSHAQFDGMEFDVERKDEKLAAMTCTIWRKDRSRPTKITEYMEECKRPTDPWKMEHRMLRHKAAIQCARYAFGFAGIYDEDEAEKIAASAISGQQRVLPPPPPPEDENPASKPVAIQAGADSTGEGPTTSHDRSASPVREDQHVDEGGAEEQPGTNWDAVYAEYIDNLKAATTFEAAEELRDAFNELDQLPREFAQRSLADYDRAVDRIEANAAKIADEKKPEPEPERKSKRKGAEGKPAANEQAADTQQADPAQSPPADSPPPPPPSDDDDGGFPGDKPAAVQATSAQRKPRKSPEPLYQPLYDEAWSKVKGGPTRFGLFWKSMSDETRKTLEPIKAILETVAGYYAAVDDQERDDIQDSVTGDAATKELARVRLLARSKAREGTKAFGDFWKQLSAQDRETVLAMSSFDRFHEICQAVDETY